MDNPVTTAGPYAITLTKVADKGTIPGHAIFEGYTIKGVTMNGLPEAGHPFVVARSERNGVRVNGIFTTSPVTATVHWAATGVVRFETANSEYRLEYVLDQTSPTEVESPHSPA
jgi:hypothetical protein